MRPVVLRIFDVPIYAYSFCLCLSFVLGMLWLLYSDRRSRTPIGIRPDIGVWIFLGAIAGARAFHVIQFGEPVCQIFSLTSSGLVFYGGFLGGLFVVLLYAWIFRLPTLPLLDRLAPCLAFGEAITRVGCFLNGCCWGLPTRLPWGVHFPRYSHPWDAQVDQGLLFPVETHSLAVHPTQLYMTLGLLVLFGILLWLRPRLRFHGGILCAYLIGYGCWRGFVETFRGDSAHDILGMTVSQCISIALIFLGAALSFWLRRRSTSVTQSEEPPVRKPPVSPLTLDWTPQPHERKRP